MGSSENKPSKKKNGLSRKDFLGRSAAAAAGFFIVPRHVLGGKGQQAPSDTLNIASVGVGGRGGGNTDALAEMGENIYALCDVDQEYAADILYRYPQAQKYIDFREMLDNEPEIDAVVVSTPDNTHAAIAIYAMQMGKHVYVEKPLTRTIYEARRMATVADETGVVTQMGNQGHCQEGTYDIVDYIRQGAIGEVERVECWTNRPRGYWPQGAGVERASATAVVPYTMNWDLWIGPSPFRPYHHDYAPFAWRGRWDFGSGALGDMGAHILDQPYWSLELGKPLSVHASSTPFNDEAFPLGSVVNYKFPARSGRPPVDLTWYDGGLTPPRPRLLEEGRQMGTSGGGMLFHGSEGILMADVYGNNPRFIPESFRDQIGPPQSSVARSENIYQEWVDACKGDGTTSSNFEYASRLTETMLLGNMAIRFSSENLRLQWDDENMRVANLDDANEWLDERNDFRPGYREIIG